MDISECADKLNAILKKLCEYRVIRSYTVHFLEDVQAIKVVFYYGKDQCYAFSICREDMNDPLEIYRAVMHYVVTAHSDLFILIKQDLHLELDSF